MSAAVLLLVAATVLGGTSTAEMCANPLPADVGEPSYCRLTRDALVRTPYFSVVVPAGEFFEVGDFGRAAVIQPSLRQAMISLHISIVPTEGAHSAISRASGVCREIVAGREVMCAEDDGMVVVDRFIVGDQSTLWLRLSAGAAARHLLERYRSALLGAEFITDQEVAR